jgi:hypothetical protein
MRSLWRQLALQWLGGEGSAALSGDWVPLDLLLAENSGWAPPGFAVTRRSEVSGRAVMSRQDREPSALEAALDGKLRRDKPG